MKLLKKDKRNRVFEADVTKEEYDELIRDCYNNRELSLWVDQYDYYFGRVPTLWSWTGFSEGHTTEKSAIEDIKLRIKENRPYKVRYCKHVYDGGDVY